MRPVSDPKAPDHYVQWNRRVLAENQPEYAPLPCVVNGDGTYCTEWELSAEDLAVLMRGGRIRLQQLTFGHPFQPVVMEVIGA